MIKFFLNLVKGIILEIKEIYYIESNLYKFIFIYSIFNINN